MERDGGEREEEREDSGDASSTLSYATPLQAGGRRLGIVGLSCALVTPAVCLSLVLLGRLDLNPGERAAVTMVLTAFASAIAGAYFSAASLHREARNGYAVAGLAISSLSICFNCFALVNA